MNIPKDKLDHIERDIQRAEKELDDDAESIITNERYVYIGSVLKGCYKKKNQGSLSTSDKIDRVVTNRWLALPIFALVMCVVYFVSIVSVGTAFTDWVNDGVFGDGFHLFAIGDAEFDEDNEKYGEEHLFNQAELGDMLKQAAEKEKIKYNGQTTAAKTLYRDFTAKEPNFGQFQSHYETYGSAVDNLGFKFSEKVDKIIEGAPNPSEYGVWVKGVPVLIKEGLEKMGCADWLQGMILDGIVKGVGSVLGFLPQMLVLFIFLAFLESCGYMSRIAFVMDRIFRKFGLSGKSFIPMLVGTGCGVPGIMASRTIENERDRRMTIMTTTFIPCGAKLPVISMIATALFGGVWWVAPSAYFLGMAAIVISGIMLKKTKMFSGEPSPFVMELPAYHMPTPSNVLRSMWERGWSFIKKAGTVILLASVVIWAGSKFGWVDGSFGFYADLELSDSILGAIGSAIKWIFIPLGFGDSTSAIATVMGLLAKEEIVGVFGVLDFVSMTKLAAYSFLAFNLLCAPCFAAIGAIRREMNSAKWTLFAIGYQCVLAYSVSLVIYQVGSVFTGNLNVVGLAFAIAVVAFVVYMLAKPYKESETLKIK